MNSIYSTDSSFDFNKLHLAKPHQIPGGSFFIRLSINNSALYIQPPKCTLKQGILKAGKKYYSDFMFTNENYEFIEWMEHLENYCQKMLYENRNDWFEGGMEMHDIENYFTSPLKIYRSGKYYLARVNISTNLGKPALRIYNEDEELISLENVKENMSIMSVLEIKGIKCSPTCFQIEMDIKQMMTLVPNNIFDKCVFHTQPKPILPTNSTEEIENNTNTTADESKDEVLVEDVDDDSEDSNNSSNNEGLNTIEQPLLLTEDTLEKNENIIENMDVLEKKDELIENQDIDTGNEDVYEEKIIVDTPTVDEVEQKLEDPIEKSQDLENLEIQEINLSLDEIPEDNSVSIKNKNHVYYEMYKEAKRKAKVARNLALSSYLEAKRIKNLYMLEDNSDSEDSDYENINEE
jgi:hypothetical protein